MGTKTKRMKAREVLRLYAAGERNFRNANLRGTNFKSQELSGADFSGADIRSANFTNATLQDVNFTQVTAGLLQQWKVVQLCLLAIVAGTLGVLQGFAGDFVATFLNGSSEGTITFVTYIYLVILIYGAISSKGLTVQAISSSLVVVAASVVLVAGATAVSGADIFTVAVLVSDAFAVAVAGAIASAVTGAIAGTVSSAIPGLVTASVTALVAVTVAVTVAVAGAETVAGTRIVTGTGTGVGLLLSLYVAWRVLKEDEKFTIISNLGLVIATVGGTSFCGANLASATFTKARLNNTNFAYEH